jgi:hypothetical protein
MIPESQEKVISHLNDLQITGSYTLLDITDRFDYAFLCGDLNFRLNITRLHADWLISRHGPCLIVIP